MIDDNTTFTLAFLSVFGGIAVYLWILDRRARRLETRLEGLDAARGSADEEGRP